MPRGSPLTSGFSIICQGTDTVLKIQTFQPKIYHSIIYHLPIMDGRYQSLYSLKTSSLKENEEKHKKNSKKFLVSETFRIFAAEMEDFRYEE